MLNKGCGVVIHLCKQCGSRVLAFLFKERKSYAGSKTLPASIKEKETHWPEVP
jgi:DNA-directed RNA polymerase subunit RPC12/RpoP